MLQTENADLITILSHLILSPPARGPWHQCRGPWVGTGSTEPAGLCCVQTAGGRTQGFLKTKPGFIKMLFLVHVIIIRCENKRFTNLQAQSTKRNIHLKRIFPNMKFYKQCWNCTLKSLVNKTNLQEIFVVKQMSKNFSPS